MKPFLKILVFLIGIPLGLSAAGNGELSCHNFIMYEYYNMNLNYSCSDNIQEGKNSPLIIMVPGITQHNASPEFARLKNYFKNKGYSYLIMNPPQHGNKTVSIRDKLFTWGKNEVEDLLELVSHLKIKANHNEIHLFGFSIGGRIVLEFSIHEKNPLAVSSIVTAAAFYRVGDINMRLSGDIRRPFSAVPPVCKAFIRAGVCDMLSMVFLGLPATLMCNTALPAKKIPGIKAPTLLLHGANDWLTKSYHSKKLFAYAGREQRFALVALNTPLHAEDILIKPGSGISKAFFSILDKWYEYINDSPGEKTKDEFNRAFNGKLLADSSIKKKIYHAKNITLMSAPTANHLNTNIWVSAANQNHSLFTANTTCSLKGEKYSRYFFTLGPTALRAPWWRKVRAGLSFEKKASSNKLSGFEFYGSLYAPFGSFLWLRRLTYIQGMGNSFNRQILSLDFALLVVDIRFDYGKFAPPQPGEKENLGQLAFDFPLINDAAGCYYLGVGYSRFLSPVPDPLFRNNLKAYLFLGPRFRLLGSRMRGHIQVEQDGWRFKGGRRLWSAGVSINLGER